MRFNIKTLTTFLALLTLPQLGFADEVNSGDTAWILTSTALVLFMTLPGLALFYGGLTRSRNVLSILMQCFVICGIATLVWLICGYSLAFTDGGSANSFIGGLGKVLFAGVLKSSVEGTIPESAFASIQMIGVIAVLIYEHRNFRDS
jgi:Amt family ammonium transporter